MNEKKVREQLDSCLIKNYLASPNSYKILDDPFPDWFQNLKKSD